MNEEILKRIKEKEQAHEDRKAGKPKKEQPTKQAWYEYDKEEGVQMPKHHVTTYDELVELLTRIQAERNGYIVPFLNEDIRKALLQAKLRKAKP